MRKLLIIALLFTAGISAHSQINGITETGDEIILYQNGTWAYKNDSVTASYEIPLNETIFEKSKRSSFLVKSQKLNIGVWINPKEWSFTKNANNDAAEFQFQKKGEDLYAMLIAEKMEIPVEALKDIAIENAKNAAPDTKVLHEEYRMINGIKVIQLKLTGTIQGIKFIYFGYYYSNSNGSVQLLTYTAQNLFEEYKSDIELFLNGFVEI